MLRFLLGLALFLAGCSTRDADILAQVFKRSSEKVTDRMPDGLAGRIRDLATEPAAAYRVRQRLRWERGLEKASIEVQPRGERGVLLQGKAPDQATKHRAVELARTTEGIDTVVDELKVIEEE